MKKAIFTFIFFLLANIASVFGQNFTLNIEVSAGSLKDSISEEIRPLVTGLVLKGSLNDADFYFMRDELPALEELDIQYVKADTIPEKAFYNKKSLTSLILPFTIKYIEDQAFTSISFLNLTISGKFPNLGIKVFERYSLVILLPDDNKDYKLVEDGRTRWLISSDEKILYFCITDYYLWVYIPEGIEIIETHAFDEAAFSAIWLPPSLKLIKESAFSNIMPLLINGTDYYNPLQVTSKSQIPPLLEENAFNDKRFSEFRLWVPVGTKDIYVKADLQWSQFKDIKEGEGTSIKNNRMKSIFIYKINKGFQIDAEKEMIKIEIFDLAGRLCYTKAVNCKSICIDNIFLKEISIVKVSLRDESTEFFKWIKKN